MTFESWTEEFEPVGHRYMIPKTWTAALDHAIRVWEGRKPENLEKHGIPANFDLGSCALCAKAEGCKVCPIFLYQGDTCEKIYFSPRGPDR